MNKLKDDFYGELNEEQKSKKNGCGCVAVAIFFVLILAVAEIVLFTFGRNLKSNPTESATPAIVSDQKFSKVDSGDGSFRVAITEGVLCSRLVADESLKDKQIFCSIDTDGIAISGKLSPLLPDRTQVKIVPEVKSETLNLKVSEVMVGKTKIPNLIPSLSSTVQSKLLEDVPELKDAKVTKVDLELGVMVVSATAQK